WTIDTIRAAFEAATGTRVCLGVPVWQSTAAPEWGVASRFYHDRVFLCGDAASSGSPLSGSAVKRLLGDATAAVNACLAIDAGISPDAAGERYSSMRRRHAASLIHWTNGLTDMLVGYLTTRRKTADQARQARRDFLAKY